MDADSPDKLVIELANTMYGRTKECTLKTLQLDATDYSIADLSYDYSINMPTGLFQQIVKDIQIFEGKTVEITSVGKQLIFKCNDGLVPEYKTVVNELEDTLTQAQKDILKQNKEESRSVWFSQTSQDIAQGRFSVTNLVHFSKAAHLCDSMELCIGNDKPLALIFYVASLGEMRFILVQS
jgi:hypothetical protein